MVIIHLTESKFQKKTYYAQRKRKIEWETTTTKIAVIEVRYRTSKILHEYALTTNFRLVKTGTICAKKNKSNRVTNFIFRVKKRTDWSIINNVKKMIVLRICHGSARYVDKILIYLYRMCSAVTIWSFSGSQHINIIKFMRRMCWNKNKTNHWWRKKLCKIPGALEFDHSSWMKFSANETEKKITRTPIK